MSNTIAFVGGGNMAQAMLRGLREAGCEGNQLRVGEPSAERRATLRAALNVRCFADNAEALRGAEVVVLAVKPQHIIDVAARAAPYLGTETIVISVAAGTSLPRLRAAGITSPLVRAMPNLPATIGQGISGLFTDGDLNADQQDAVERVMTAAGDIVWVADEALMDAVTAISGSGPAYFFLLVEAMTAAGEGLGLPREAARQLASKTGLGAMSVLAQSPDDAANWRARVTSPGGTTAAALDHFESHGFRQLVASALQAANDRGAELNR